MNGHANNMAVFFYIINTYFYKKSTTIMAKTVDFKKLTNGAVVFTSNGVEETITNPGNVITKQLPGENGIIVKLSNETWRKKIYMDDTVSNSSVVVSPFANLNALTEFLSGFFPKAGGGAGTDASALTTGTLPDARLSSNVPIKVAGKIVASDLDLTAYATTSGVTTSLDAIQVLGNPNWTGTNAALLKSPVVGGRERPNRIIGKRTLAHFATKPDTNQSALGTLADVFSNDALYGNSVLQFTSIASTVLTLAPANANAIATNVVGGLIRFNYMPVLNVNSRLDRFSLELHSAGTPGQAVAPTANFHSIDVAGTGVAVSDFKQRLTSLDAQGRFQSWNIPVSMFSAAGTGADLTQILFARLVLRSSSAGSMTINIGNIEFIPNKLTKAKCILNFDDGYQSQVTVASVLMAKYGFPGTLYPGAIATFLDINSSFATSKNLKNLQNNHGWQVAAQAFSSESQGVIDAKTEAQFTADMADLIKLYKTFGLTGWQDGSYFSGVGATDSIARPVFEKMFRTMRTFNSGNASGLPFIYPETFPFGDAHLVKSLNGATSAWAATTGTQLQAHIDQAIANKGVALITWHDDIKTATSNAKDGFISLLAYLDAQRANIDVITIDDLFNIV